MSSKDTTHQCADELGKVEMRKVLIYTDVGCDLVEQIATAAEFKDHVQARHISHRAILEVLFNAQEGEDIAMLEDLVDLDLFAQRLPVWWMDLSGCLRGGLRIRDDLDGRHAMRRCFWVDGTKDSVWSGPGGEWWGEGEQLA